MILFLTLIYVGLLFSLVKANIIKLTLAWKISPLIWMTFLMVALFIPMQFWAPAGKAIVMQHSIPIVPNVAGHVIEVAVEPNIDLKKGDLLFKLDPTPFQAARDQIKAQLDLAKLRLNDAKTLIKSNAVSQARVDQYQAQVKQYSAALKGAEYNLAETEVRAPADGFVTNLALRPGARVAAIPLSQSMAFVENNEHLLGAQIPQGYLRFVEPGQEVEVTFTMFPGRIFSAKVDYVVRANASGQVLAGGKMVSAREINAVPFMVRLKLDDQAFMRSLPAGAVASVAIYSESGKGTHIIRKVMIRMESFMNFIKPF
jgi:multidrug resistance efflux pump